MLLVICNRGFGSMELFHIVVSSHAALSLSYNVGKKDIKKTIAFSTFFIISLLYPSLFLLWGCVALYVTICCKKYILIPTTYWIFECLGVLPSTYLAVCIIFTLVVLLIHITHYKIITYCTIGICSCTIFCEVTNFLQSKNDVIIENKEYNVYGQSLTFQRISGCSIDSSYYAKKRVIRNKSYGTTISDDVPGIVIYDVDLKEKDTFANPRKLQQRVPWNSQLYLGDQYFLESISADGALFSNIGITLNKQPNSINLLSRPINFISSVPLILKKGETLYLNDSDYTSSYIANYQKNFIQELVGERHNERPILMRLINVICLIIILLLSFCEILRHEMPSIILVLSCFLGSIVLFVFNKQEYGEIRMVGKIKNSHENSSFDGVPKTINNAGFEYVIGVSDAKILVVKEGHKAKWKGEKLIVAEPNSIIELKNHKIAIEEMPMGVKNEIIDSRRINMDNDVFEGICKIDSITIIGTGSPAKIQWKRFIR